MVDIPVSQEYKETWTKNIWCEYFENVIFKKGYLEHSHPNFEIVYFIRADTKEFIKDIAYNIKDGDMVFIDEYEVHRIIAAKDNLGSGYVLHFKRAFIDKFLALFNAESILAKVFRREIKVVNLNLRHRELAEIFMSSLVKTYERYVANPRDPILHASMVAQLFNLLVSGHKYIPPDITPPIVSKPEEIIRRIIVFIDENYRESVKLDDIANRFNLNKYYLSHLFKELTGFTLFEYILHRRVIVAQKLLKDTNYSIEAIAARSGFANLQYFYKVFRKIARTSPAAFRKTRGHNT